MVFSAFSAISGRSSSTIVNSIGRYTDYFIGYLNDARLYFSELWESYNKVGELLPWIIWSEMKHERKNGLWEIGMFS